MNDKTLTFHNDPEFKARLIRECVADREEHRLVKGQYWEHGKGCAVGCRLNDPTGGHARYEREFGIPEWLAWLEDNVFEGVKDDLSWYWPERFFAAIPVGVGFAALDLTQHRLMAWMLSDESPSAVGNDHKLVRDAVATCRVLHERAAAGEPIARDDWLSARSAVWSAAESARAASAEAAWAAIADKTCQLLVECGKGRSQ